MNSYQRVMTALELGEPDQVPILEWAVCDKVIKALCPKASDQTDFEDLMGLDVVMTHAQFNKVAQNPDGSYVDEWGVTFRPGPETDDHPIKAPIQTLEDLKNYVRPDPDAPHRLAHLRELVTRFKGKKAIILSHRAAFMWSAFLNGLENLLVNFLEQPEFVHHLMDTVLESSIGIARNAVCAGADAIVLADDCAGNEGPFFSRAVYREFVFPGLKRAVDAIHEVGGKAIAHSDGRLWPILDLIVNTGIDGLNPMEPAAGMDIGEVKREYGKRTCLIGNIDCGYILSEASVGEVREAVRDCMRKASPGGGHIITSSNSIHTAVKPENYLAMIEAARQYGRYPRPAEVA
jgi:uroporphyrinogen decarboxylase